MKLNLSLNLQIIINKILKTKFYNNFNVSSIKFNKRLVLGRND